MKFLTQKTDVLSRASQCAVVFALDDTLLPSAALLDEQLNGLLCDLLIRGDLKSKPGQLRWIPIASSSPLKCERALLVHLGKSSGKKNRRVSAEQVVTALVASANALTRSPVKEASFFLDELFVEQQGLTIEKDDAAVGPEWFAEQLAKTLVYSSYRYTETHSDPDPKPALSKVVYATTSTATTRQLNAGLKRGGALGNGINLARELGNLPPNICTPIYLAELAKSMATGNGRLSSRSLTEKQMDKLGMNAFVSVAKGSYQDARLVIMEYKGTAAASSKPHVLVGKGITFDTGGISLKPGPSMDEMKFDMCGAASVFGTMRALIDMDAKVHVIGVVAAAENMPDGKASKPGDVVKSLSGQTIEILNTDAEGRLVLCDTLTYVERFKPRSVVDIATLTGACVVALGNHASGLYSNHQPMAEKLLNAGRQANDRAWQMPLWDDYQKQLDSNFADMANIGGPAAGSVTAACFLSRFAKKYHWAHLDIAGTAWHSGAKKGATGRPVGLLVNYLLNA